MKALKIDSGLEYDKVSDYIGQLFLELHSKYQFLGLYKASHYVAHLDTIAFGPVCLKIHMDVFSSSPLNAWMNTRSIMRTSLRKNHFFRTDIEAFKVIGNEVYWSPKLYLHAEDNSWFIREWRDGVTLDDVIPDAWSHEALSEFWRFMYDALNTIHASEGLTLRRDIGTLNICFDGRNFSLFDPFKQSKVRTKSRYKMLTMKRRLRRILHEMKSFWNTDNSSLSKRQMLQPANDATILEGNSVQADLFTFANLFCRFATGQSIRTNRDLPVNILTEQSQLAFDVAAGHLRPRMAALGFSDEDRDFVLCCLSPVEADRPEKMMPMTASSN